MFNAILNKIFSTPTRGYEKFYSKYQGEKMAKSSINLQISHKNTFEHNLRILEKELEYIFKEHSHENIYSCDLETAKKLVEQYLAEATQNYYNRTKQRIQTDPKHFQWSAVVNLNAEHTLDDLKKLTDELEKRYGWRCVQIAIHNDEGQKGENGELIRKNRHAHLEFFMLDKNGIYRFKRRDFSKKTMSEIQTLVANMLNMTRGHNYYAEFKDYQQEMTKWKKWNAIKQPGASLFATFDRSYKELNNIINFPKPTPPTPKPKRLNARQYAQEAQRKERERRELEKKQKDELEAKIKELNTDYRAKLKVMGAKRADYAIYEAFIKELRARIARGGDFKDWKYKDSYINEIFAKIDTELIAELQLRQTQKTQSEIISTILEPVTEIKKSNLKKLELIKTLQSDLNAEKAKNDELVDKLKQNDLDALEKRFDNEILPLAKKNNADIFETAENSIDGLSSDPKNGLMYNFVNVAKKIVEPLKAKIQELTDTISQLMKTNAELTKQNTELQSQLLETKKSNANHQQNYNQPMNSNDTTKPKNTYNPYKPKL